MKATIRITEERHFVKEVDLSQEEIDWLSGVISVDEETAWAYNQMTGATVTKAIVHHEVDY